MNSPSLAAAPGPWSGAYFRAHPLRVVGIVLHLLLRTLFGLFWIAAGANFGGWTKSAKE